MVREFGDAGPTAESSGPLVRHASPVWGERADSKVHLDSEYFGVPEELDCLRVDSESFVLCCVPFLTWGLALGDEVTAERSGDVLREGGSGTTYVMTTHVIKSECWGVFCEAHEVELLRTVVDFRVMPDGLPYGIVTSYCVGKVECPYWVNDLR